MKLKSTTGDLVHLQNLSLGRPAETPMLKGQESVMALLLLCSLWKCTWGGLPLHHLPLQSLCLLLSKAAWEVSDTSTTFIWCPLTAHTTVVVCCKSLPDKLNRHCNYLKQKNLCWVVSKTVMTWTFFPTAFLLMNETIINMQNNDAPHHRQNKKSDKLQALWSPCCENA